MFKFTVTTVRPTANAPFFIHTATGQVYQELLMQAKSERPKSDVDETALISFERTESDDGLTMISTYKFGSIVGKNELYAEEVAIVEEAGMPSFKTARDEYNAVHDHVTTIESEIT